MKDKCAFPFVCPEHAEEYYVSNKLTHTIYVYRYEDGTTQVKCDTGDLHEIECILQDAIQACDPDIGRKVEQQ